MKQSGLNFPTDFTIDFENKVEYSPTCLLINIIPESVSNLGYKVDLKIESNFYDSARLNLGSQLDYDCYFKKMSNGVEVYRVFKECNR